MLWYTNQFYELESDQSHDLCLVAGEYLALGHPQQHCEGPEDLFLTMLDDFHMSFKIVLST